MNTFLKFLKTIPVWLKEQQVAMSTHDATSWITHWAICMASTGLLFLVVWGTSSIFAAAVWAKILAEFWLAFFSHREGGDIEKHRAAGHSMLRYQWDRVGDLVGAIINDVAWWLVFWWVVVVGV